MWSLCNSHNSCFLSQNTIINKQTWQIIMTVSTWVQFRHHLDVISATVDSLLSNRSKEKNCGTTTYRLWKWPLEQVQLDSRTFTEDHLFYFVTCHKRPFQLLQKAGMYDRFDLNLTCTCIIASMTSTHRRMHEHRWGKYVRHVTIRKCISEAPICTLIIPIQ